MTTQQQIRTYTVIATSGWQGDGWHYVGEFDSRREAQARADAVAQPNARFDGYLVAVIGGTRICDLHDRCLVGDTSRVHLREPWLVGRQTHIDLRMEE